jgi:hypothetical protein
MDRSIVLSDPFGLKEPLLEALVLTLVVLTPSLWLVPPLPLALLALVIRRRLRVDLELTNLGRGEAFSILLSWAIVEGFGVSKELIEFESREGAMIVFSSASFGLPPNCNSPSSKTGLELSDPGSVEEGLAVSESLCISTKSELFDWERLRPRREFCQTSRRDIDFVRRWVEDAVVALSLLEAPKLARSSDGLSVKGARVDKTCVRSATGSDGDEGMEL